MKIVLVRPKYNSHIITPPLGLGYLSSYLKENGFESTIIDGLRDNLDNDQLVEKILSEKPDVVGITCLTAFYNEVVELSQMIKKHKLPCIIGGVHPTFLPYQTLRDSGADFVVCGEGEIALRRLLENNLDNTGIAGVYSITDIKDESLVCEKAEIINNLDDLPFPDWDQINPNTYPKAPHGAIVKNFPVGVIMTTRGCPYNCIFCASPRFYDRKIRYRSPENVLREIELLVNNYGVKEIHFEDDNLTLKRSHAESICKKIVANNIKISWACPNGIRADRVDEELLDLMEASGCYYFAYGIESADPEILRNIKKEEEISQIADSIVLADKKGISCQGFFIFGLPGETHKTIDTTINFARSSKLSRAQFLILDVLPGSQLWDTLSGKFQPNWKKASYREPEWIPEGLTRDDLMRAQSKAFRSFYFRPSVFFKLGRMIKLNQIFYLIERLKDYRIVK